MRTKVILRILTLLIYCLTLLGCESCDKASGPSPNAFRIIAGSENKDLEPILKKFADQEHVELAVTYLGSVDIGLKLETGTVDADAVLPASSFWIQTADKKKIVRNSKSVMRSPVVFGVKMSVAERLGWIKNPKVTVNDILEASTSGKFRFAMTSATQSNSGAAAYLGFLSALANHPDMLLHEHLVDAKVQEKVRKLLSTVNRSSGSSGWLRDLMVRPDVDFDAMVNYEAMVISANRELTAKGQEPLCAIYPEDGMTIADFPLGFIDQGDPAKAAFFAKLQTYLLSAPAQTEIEQLGRRAGALGLETLTDDQRIFNPAWCIDLKRTISPIPPPGEAVISEALELYQTLLRKPSFSVYVLDFSGSMQGNRETQLKTAMTTLLDSSKARAYLLQASTRDVNVVIPFSSEPFAEWKCEGNNESNLAVLLNKIRGTNASGGTGLYAAVAKGLQVVEQESLAHPDRNDPKHMSQYFPAIILMTDGDATDTQSVLDAYLANHPAMKDVPIFSILFGEANRGQLDALSRKGRVFDGTKDLGKAIREAKQYN